MVVPVLDMQQILELESTLVSTRKMSHMVDAKRAANSRIFMFQILVSIPIATGISKKSTVDGQATVKSSRGRIERPNLAPNDRIWARH